VQLGRTKAIKHNRGIVAYFHNHLSPNLSQWKEGSHDSYLWLQVNRSVAHNLFVYVVYIAPIGSKHKIKSLFQNLAVDIVEVQTIGGIVLLGGDFNAHIVVLPNTIDTSDLCELLHAPELAETKQPSVVAKRQDPNASVGGWGCELLALCYDIRLFILNGRTPGDKSGEFTCLANGAHNTIDYIIGSHAI
jgi:hypothetical protein